MINSIQKGKRFERAMVYVMQNLTGVIWHRVPNSGAMATSQNIEDFRYQADLFCEDPRYSNWGVEAKITFHTLNLNTLFSDKSTLWRWWKQTVGENKGKVPILVFKYYHSNVFIMSDHEDIVRTLCKDNGKFVIFVDSEMAKLYCGMVVVKKGEEADKCESAEIANTQS
jgi:hypothetical protein